MRRPPRRPRSRRARRHRYRDGRWHHTKFLTLAAGMALALFAQIGLLAHLFSILVPVLGADHAGVAMGSGRPRHRGPHAGRLADAAWREPARHRVRELQGAGGWLGAGRAGVRIEHVGAPAGCLSVRRRHRQRDVPAADDRADNSHGATSSASCRWPSPSRKRPMRSRRAPSARTFDRYAGDVRRGGGRSARGDRVSAVATLTWEAQWKQVGDDCPSEKRQYEVDTRTRQARQPHRQARAGRRAQHHLGHDVP